MVLRRHGELLLLSLLGPMAAELQFYPVACAYFCIRQYTRSRLDKAMH